MDVSQSDRTSVGPALCQEDDCDRPLQYVKLQMCRPHYLALSRSLKEAKGLCRYCGKKRSKGYVYCSRCRGLRKRYYYGAIDEGVCTRCRTQKPTKGKTTCEQCRLKNNRDSSSTKQLYKAEGICVNCGRRKVEKGILALKRGNYSSCGLCKKASRRRYARVEK